MNGAKARRETSRCCVMALALAIAMPSVGRADSCLADIWENGTLLSGYVFPNWRMVPVGNFTAMMYDGMAGTEIIRGITVVNLGTATNADIKAVYLRAWCSTANTGLLTLSYAGMYLEDTGAHPAWTWTGSSPDFSLCAELWTPGPGGFTVDLYIDVEACPTTMRTVSLAFTANSTNNTTWWGSMSDNQACAAPWIDTPGPPQTIVYAYKIADRDIAAPGDTVEYTIFYGRSGLNPNLARITIIDTQAPYSHYVPGSGSPAPDAGWDPDPGPPPAVKWTVNGPLAVGGGPTNQVSFSVSIDWGNGEGFEPGSGDAAAPEGFRLRDQAYYEAEGTTCTPAGVVSNPAETVVRRYMFWKIADQDLLFASNVGSPDDEITYEIFLKNMSQLKTWWNLSVWDTVPAELNVWAPNCGFEDLCVGWTMTPTGCAPANPGKRAAGGGTLLTWKIDLPPSMTLTLRWKAVVKPSVAAGATAANVASVLALGRTGIINGTGHAGQPRNFTHVAPIMLRTTYSSYLAAGGSGADEEACPYGFYVHFFPPNKATNFELRKLEYQGPNDCGVPMGTWPNDGGVSASIGVLVGTCIGGFVEGGTSGCRAERAPATYWPNQWRGVCPSWPFHFIYKVTSNSPVMWEHMRQTHNTEDQASIFTPSTSNSFSGYAHYTYMRQLAGTTAAGYGDELNIVNTDPVVPTTVHIFQWDAANSVYSYVKTGELDVESEWMPFQGTPDGDQGYYKVISSDGKLVIWQSDLNNGTISCLCYAGISNLCPTRETGYLTSPPGGNSTFYAFCHHRDDNTHLMVGNVGASAATYEIHRYVPYSQTLVPGIPPTLSGTSGHWVPISEDSVPAGIAPPNAHVYGCAGFDTGKIGTAQPYLGLYRITQKSGGGLQVMAGNGMHYRGAASILHDASGLKQGGSEFWYHHVVGGDGCSWHTGCDTCVTYTLDVFCPKSGTAVRMTSNDGYTARYTTNGPDQCISFRQMTNITACGVRRNYKVEVLTPGDTISMYNHCSYHEKILTAPFLGMGTHYIIVAPPIVYLGQSFWITVIVVETGGATDTDYAATTSFTSTDPGAQIEGQGMAGYDYDWQGSENGVKVFVKVSFGQLGLQTIVASDTEDGSITGLTSLMVVAADVKLTKEPMLTIASSGETIQFRVCWSNYSSATASNFVITDAIPMGTSYVPEAASLMFCGSGGPAVPTVTVAYGTASATTPAVFNTLTSPTQTAPASTRWLRWTVQDVYVYSTGCACFRVRVD